MYPDANLPVHPSRRQRFRLRFWAVFVFGVELGRYSDAFVGHAGRDILLRLKPSILAHAPK
jgi:hypothetical protein